MFASSPHGGTVANLIALGLLGGAVAKSAQIPLHTWLPDAMEGPTPVSALIHAATMVTAGVYLIVRCHPLFENAPKVEDLAAGLGAVTLLMAGLIALVQVDIKRVIAYSTMSQIGYMFVGAGVGAYSSAMFHLMTHAFFKALLFLAAGIVIHALAGEQDMRRMGGLGTPLRFTRNVFLVGALALVGIPPLAGFFSKDSIIAATLTKGGFGYFLFAACLAGAFLTGLYTFRMFFIVFGGQRSAFAQEHLHLEGDLDGPISMIWTVAVLAILSATAGLLQFTPLWHPLTDLARPGRAEHGRPERDAGGDRLGLRRRARARRDLGRLCRLRHEEAEGAEAGDAVREEVLLGRALRRRLLQAGRPDLARPRPVLRAAGDQRLDRRAEARVPASAPVSSPAPRTASSARTSLALASGVAVLALVFISTR